MTLMNMVTKKDKNFVIVIGNEKGGTGKSTISMHLITYLLNLGFKVASVDVDARQGTLTRYVENRLATQKREDVTLKIPDHHPLYRSQDQDLEKATQEDVMRFQTLLSSFEDYDFIIIDTPGTDMPLSRCVHSYADLLVSPLNDSFIDLDMLGRIDADTGEVIRPSTYAEMVWEQKKARAMRRENTFDWVVMRNRLSSIYAKNKEDMQQALEALGKRLGFRVLKGFGERVIFRELFLKGLTVLDLEEIGLSMSISHVAARQELRSLLEGFQLPQIQEKLQEKSKNRQGRGQEDQCAA